MYKSRQTILTDSISFELSNLAEESKKDPEYMVGPFSPMEAAKQLIKNYKGVLKGIGRITTQKPYFQNREEGTYTGHDVLVVRLAYANTNEDFYILLVDEGVRGVTPCALDPFDGGFMKGMQCTYDCMPTDEQMEDLLRACIGKVGVVKPSIFK